MFVAGAQAFEQVNDVWAQVGAERDRSQAVVGAGSKQRGEGVDVVVLAPVLSVEDARNVVDPRMEDGFREAAISDPGELEEMALDGRVDKLDVVIPGHDREAAAAPAEVTQRGNTVRWPRAMRSSAASGSRRDASSPPAGGGV